MAIARALAAQPDLLICDEVTSALDVSVQAAVLELLAELRKDLALSMLFISHDLGVVASISDRVLVLNSGRTCEQGSVRSVIQEPGQDYTRRLIAAAPRLDSRFEWTSNAPSGCCSPIRKGRRCRAFSSPSAVSVIESFERLDATG